jgi:hypothetical protein
MNTRCIDGTEFGDLIQVSLAFPMADGAPQLVIDIAALVPMLPFATESGLSSFVFTADALSVLSEMAVDRNSAEGVAGYLEEWAAKIREPFV